MAQNTIRLPLDGNGKYLDTWDLVNSSAVQVNREVDRIGGVAIDEVADVLNKEPTPTDYGLITRSVDVTQPITDVLFSTDLAPDATVDLTGTVFISGKTGYLMSVVVSSSISAKWQIKSSVGGIDTVLGIIFTNPLNLTFTWNPPSKHHNIISGNGANSRFKITVTNMDVVSADIYSTIYSDES